MAEAGSSTKQLEQKLGFGDLMGSAVGQIIGAGIMSLMPSAIVMTGRSVPIAFLIAAIITCITAIPYIFISSTVRLRGGIYTQVAMLGGPKFAGMYVITTFTGCFSLAMYCNSLADYVGDLFAWEAGTKKMAALAVILIFSLIIFAVMGIGKVQWEGYFDNSDGYFMSGSLMGLLQAGGLLTFATGGATSVLNFSAEAKNPTRDIPLVMIVSTLAVAVMYGFLAFVAAGVLPYEEVAGQNLTVVANFVLNRPLYILFVVGAVCCVSGLSISVLSNMCILASAISNVVVFWNTRKIPDMFPDQWAKSPYHISKGLLTVICAISTCASLFNSYLNASSLSTTLLILNGAILAGALGFGFVREKHAHMDISYETVD